MTGLLQWLVDFFGQLVCWIMTALVLFLNLILAALAALVAGLLVLLPPMPDGLPEPPEQLPTAASWIAWFFPVSTVVEILLFVIAAQLVWWGVQLGLRWAKGVE
jgi:hypothetical protein